MRLLESGDVFIRHLYLTLLIVILIIILPVSVHDILFFLFLAHIGFIGEHDHGDISAAVLFDFF